MALMTDRERQDIAGAIHALAEQTGEDERAVDRFVHSLVRQHGAEATFDACSRLLGKGVSGRAWTSVKSALAGISADTALQLAAEQRNSSTAAVAATGTYGAPPPRSRSTTTAAVPSVIPPEWIEEAARERHRLNLIALNLDAEATSFVSYYQGKGTTSPNWRAMWKAWCLHDKTPKPYSGPPKRAWQ